MMSASAGTMWEDLPILVMVEIGHYLSASDINSCCAVCRTWHNNFGQDLFWERLCNKNITDYLTSTPCKVPDVQDVMRLDPALAHMSRWRVNYGIQNQLRKNWIHGKCNQGNLNEVFQDIRLDHLYPRCLHSAAFHGNDFLFLFFSGSVRIYNVAEAPLNREIFIREIFYELPYDFRWDELIFVKLLNDKFVVIQNNYVKVFDISVTDDWQVSFTFLFNKTEEESRIATESESVLKYMDGRLRTQECSEIITGDLYIGIARLRELLEKHIVVMHIWNIRTKRKLKAETVPIDTKDNMISVHMYTDEITSDNIVIECIKNKPRSNNAPPFIAANAYYFVYNLNSLTFYPIRVVYFSSIDKPNPVLKGHSLYVSDTNGLFVYDINQTNHVIRSYSLTGYMFTVIAGDTITTTFDYELLRCKVMDVYSGQIDWLRENEEIMQCDKIWDEIVMYSYRHSVRECRDRNSSLWYLGKMRKRIFFYPGNYVCHNKSCTKLLLNDRAIYDLNQGRLTLMSFW